ncbi:uncharacterized protein LOC121023242 isoform X2 [Herpailurus yagouaroundi]|uniref:uncharacterized protein LOC121023242 isoform X2 n=1 Tax=Herpailurus yagouaroundi TaxID=1608482 RepID=UPI001AD63CEE|nr:uncharacterized protein LOC121023242 isoform X2 [Puma yagouaroundi]
MDGDNRQINRDRGGMHPCINYSVSEKSHQMNSGCRSKLFSDSTVKLALAWDSIIGTAGEVNELSDTDASGTRPEEQRQEREQGAEAAVGPERAVLRSPPAPDSPRSTAPTSEPAWSCFDLRDPGLLRTDLELVNWDTRPCLGSEFSGKPQDFTLDAGKKTGVFNDLEARSVSDLHTSELSVNGKAPTVLSQRVVADSSERPVL